MKVKYLAVLLLGCLAMLLLAASPASATCVARVVASPPPDLNAEGLYERASDIIIYDNGVAPACFTNQGIVTVTYNALLSYPASFTAADQVVGGSKTGYWAISDGTGALTIGTVTVEHGNDVSGTVTVIEFDIEKGTTNGEAALIVENLRFDVTGTNPLCTGLKPTCETVADNSPLNAYVGQQGVPSTGPYDVGNVKRTIDPSDTGIKEVGWGFEDGVCPFVGAFHCGYPNHGSATHSLVDQAWWEMKTNGAWKTDFPFRRPLPDDMSPNISDPVQNLGATDLVIHVENIMAGVTVTLPDSLVLCDGLGHKKVEWDWTKGAKVSTKTGDLVGIYQTTFADLSVHSNPVDLKVGTTNPAEGPENGCDEPPYPDYPKILVDVGNPSLTSPDGTQQAYLQVVMGPGIAPAAFAGDDIMPANTFPLYLSDTVVTDKPTRGIIGDASIKSPNAQPYFFLNPTETVILYPYVTNTKGWETGIEIGDTGLDKPVFGNVGQNGLVDFYFFGSLNGGAPSTISLIGVGPVTAGSDYANTLSSLLTAQGQPAGTTFTGYIIVVAHFNYGHGAGILFMSSAGAVTNAAAVPGLILGGHCSYNPNTAAPIPSTGAPDWPACSTARTGDLSKLPEQLKM